jgi:hypothetical protein
VNGTVERAIAADAEVSAGRSDQGLGVQQDKAPGNRCRSTRQFRRETFALVRIEHCESLNERDRIGLVSIALGPPAFLIGDKAVGIDDGGAVLALTDITAQAERLAEREPVLGAEPVLDHRVPEGQHIDPRVLALGRGILRHGERRFGRHGSPRLNPGHAAGLELGDDLVGDFLIQARPVPTGTSASG